MYGLLLNSALAYLQQAYPEIYSDVLEELGFSEQRDIDQHQIYSEKLFGRIAKIAAEKTGSSEEQLKECFGEYFVDYTIRVGYNDLLFSLGRTLSDLFNELDNLHEYIRFTYPKLKAPSFIVLNESPEGITLLYRSRRQGFQSYVKGILRSIAMQYYSTSINIETTSIKEIGERQEVVFSLAFDNSNRYAASGDVILRDNYFKNKVIMADTIFELYPFHILINEGMEILSIGKGLKQLFPKALRDDFSSLFEIARPDIEPNFRAIQHHLNNIFELNCILSRYNSDTPGGPAPSAKAPLDNQPSTSNRSQDSGKGEEELILKGQMMYIEEWTCVLFVGFPLLMTPEQMLKIGLYLSDLSLFDSSRDLVMAAAQDAADHQLTQKLLSVKSDIVAEANHMAEKAKEDWQRTHYALLPQTIAQRLMRAEPAYNMAAIYERATVVSVEIIDERLHSVDKALFTLIEDIHKEAQEICAKYDMFKVDGRLTDFVMLAGVPNVINGPELAALRAAQALASSFTVRLGIATGQVAAGIVGSKLLAYKPFGNAVKMSRKLMMISTVRRVLADEATMHACTKDKDVDADSGPDLQDAQISYKTFWLHARKPNKDGSSKKK